MTFRKVPLGKDGWPIEMPIPHPKHWCKGAFINEAGKGCLVGWGRYVFSGGLSPRSANAVDVNIYSQPYHAFIGRVFRKLGMSIPLATEFDMAWKEGKIDGKKVTAAWEKVAAEFGYTEDV